MAVIQTTTGREPGKYGAGYHMKATCIFHDRKDCPDGAIAELTIWQVPEPVPVRAHGLKYSLFYGYPGRRLVGYDNELGRGDHRHIDGREELYAFTTAEILIADFVADVRKLRGDV